MTNDSRKGNRRRVSNVLRKEWEFVFKDINGALYVTVLPLLIVGQGILYVWLAQAFGSESILGIPLFQAAIDRVVAALPAAAGLPDIQKLLVLLLTQFNFWLLLVPTLVAVVFASTSIVDEKLSRSLEPLLATPVRTWELLLGKALSGAIPAVLATWVCGGVFLAIMAAMGWGGLIAIVVNPAWFISLFLLNPAVAVLSFILGVIGSSKARDTKSAQNLSMAVIFPVFALIAAQTTGFVWFDPILMLVLVGVLGGLDYLLLRVATRLFQRESILVQWK